MKTCSKCKQAKPLDAFHRDKTRSDGRFPQCKACHQAYQREWRQRPDRKTYMAAYLRQWHAAHPGWQKEHSRRWYEQNPDKVRASAKRQNASERAKERKRQWAQSAHGRQRTIAWQEANRERITQLHHNYYVAHMDSIRERVHNWNVTHRIQRQAQERRRQLMIRANGGSHTPQEWRAVLEAHDYACARCKSTALVTADHIIPISRGGSDDITNLQPLCVSCNSSKSTRSTDYRSEHAKAVVAVLLEARRSTC